MEYEPCVLSASLVRQPKVTPYSLMYASAAEALDASATTKIHFEPWAAHVDFKPFISRTLEGQLGQLVATICTKMEFTLGSQCSALRSAASSSSMPATAEGQAIGPTVLPTALKP